MKYLWWVWYFPKMCPMNYASQCSPSTRLLAGPMIYFWLIECFRNDGKSRSHSVAVYALVSWSINTGGGQLPCRQSNSPQTSVRWGLKLTTWRKRVGEREEGVRKRRGEEERGRDTRDRRQSWLTTDLCFNTVYFGVVCYKAIGNPHVNKVRKDYRNCILISMI